MLTAIEARVLSEDNKQERIEGVLAFIKSRALDGGHVAKFDVYKWGGVLTSELEGLGYKVETHDLTVVVEW